MRPYSPGGALIALATARKGSIPPTPSAHRLLCGLPGYLILFAPRTFAPQRQYCTSEPLSPPVFLLISTHFTATPGIPLASHRLKPRRIEGVPGVEPQYFTLDAHDRLHALYTQSFRVTLAPYVLPRLLARKISRGLFHGYRHRSGSNSRVYSSPSKEVYDP